jgi:hypothetical protein
MGKENRYLWRSVDVMKDKKGCNVRCVIKVKKVISKENGWEFEETIGRNEILELTEIWKKVWKKMFIGK